MQQVEVDVLGAQPRQRIVQVGGDVEGRHALAILVVMRAFGDDHDLVAHPARFDPAPNVRSLSPLP
jgi:hypothetical protein